MPLLEWGPSLIVVALMSLPLLLLLLKRVAGDEATAVILLRESDCNSTVGVAMLVVEIYESPDDDEEVWLLDERARGSLEVRGVDRVLKSRDAPC
jgi:hypothetical protein